MSLYHDSVRYLKTGASLWAAPGLFMLGLLSSKRLQSSRLRKPIARIHSLCVRPALVAGQRIYVRPGDYSHMLIFDEVFLNHNYDLSQLSFEPDLIMDCGAHIGLFTVLARHRFPKARCLAFEPNPDNLAYLHQQIAANQMAVTVVEAAVSDRQDTAVFGGSSSCNGKIVAAAEAGSGTYQVKLVDLVKILKEEAPSRLLLKMDIEGEEETLLPLLLPLLPAQCSIFFETHRGDESWARHESGLKSHGFSVTRINARDSCSDGYAWRGSSR